MKNSTKSIILLFLTAIIWGFAFVAQTVVVGVLSSYAFNGIRFVLGGISLIPVILIFEKEEKNGEKLKRTILAGICAGIILFIASTLQQVGIEFTKSAGKAGFLTGLYTILVPIIYFLFFRKKTHPLTWLGAVFALFGLYLLTTGGAGFDSIGIGDIILIIGAIFWSLHIIVIDRFVESISPVKFAMTQFLVCGIIGLLFTSFTGGVSLEGIRISLIPILYGGIMSAGVAYTCQILGQKNADPTFATIILSTESVFSAIGGAIILGETMTLFGYLGCALIFAGIVLAQLKQN